MRGNGGPWDVGKRCPLRVASVVDGGDDAGRLRLPPARGHVTGEARKSVWRRRCGVCSLGGGGRTFAVAMVAAAAAKKRIIPMTERGGDRQRFGVRESCVSHPKTAATRRQRFGGTQRRGAVSAGPDGAGQTRRNERVWFTGWVGAFCGARRENK